MPEFKPRIILQTKTYRVIAKARPPFDGNPRSDEILVEERRLSAMNEEYWGPVHDLWDNRSAMTKDERFILALFQEVAKDGISQPSVVNKTSISIMLIELVPCLTSKVAIEPSMPFDNRDGAVGLALTPGVMSTLRQMFPGSEQASAAKLVSMLLIAAAQEMA